MLFGRPAGRARARAALKAAVGCAPGGDAAETLRPAPEPEVAAVAAALHEACLIGLQRPWRGSAGHRARAVRLAGELRCRPSRVWRACPRRSILAFLAPIRRLVAGGRQASGRSRSRRRGLFSWNWVEAPRRELGDLAGRNLPPPPA